MGEVLGILVAVVVLGGGYWMYARAIALRNRAREGLSAVDVQLQKRRDLLPNLLVLAERFMAHERELLERLTELRARVRELPGAPTATRSDTGERLQIDSALSSAFGTFFAVAENYPELKSQQAVANAQQGYSEVEGHIAAARRFYNANVTELNNWAETFPMNLFCRIAGAEPMPWFQASEDAHKGVDARDHLR